MEHKQGKNRHQLFLTSLDGMVSEDSWARLVDLLVDAMPLEDFGFTHLELNREGNEPYHPGDLFKLLLYGYRKGIRSASRLEEACVINVEVMWLLKGLRPSKRTINYFRGNNTEPIERAHRFFVRVLRDWKLIGGESFAIDGTKIRGQNSLKRNFNAKKIRRHLDYIDNKIGEYLDQLDEEESSSRRGKRQRIAELEDKVEKLEDRRKEYEVISEEVAQSEDGQVSLSDPDARAVIKHRNIVEVGYNIQATVDEQHNMVVDVFAAGVNDLNALSKGGKRVQEILEVEKIELLADAGYHNGIEIARCERRGIRTWVAPKKHHSSSQEGYKKEDFIYDTKADNYTCPAGEQLITNGTKYRKTKHGNYRFKRYANYRACQACALRAECTKREAGRLLERPVHQASIDRNNRRVERYRWFYRLRQQIVEPVFGTWKRHWHLDHTLLRGKAQVETEYRLAAICTNLGRSMSVLGITEVKKRLEALISLIFGLFATLMVGVACEPVKIRKMMVLPRRFVVRDRGFG